MKKSLLLFTIFLSFNSLSQRYNLKDERFQEISPFDRNWDVNMNIVDSQIMFNWEKDIVTSIIIKSLDDDIFFPKIDAFMTSQLTLNSLKSGRYQVFFLDDCNAIMNQKEFEIK